MTVQETINSAVNYAVGIANDNSHGYSQYNRWGNPDFDCSSLIITAWEQAGVKVKEAGATYTGNMKAAFLKCGFIEVPLKDRRKGDVLLNEIHHTAMMIDNYNLVHASISETGKITGKSGDQTGNEICTRSYYNYSKGWDCVLRYVGINTKPTTKEEEKIQMEVSVVKKGVKSVCVGTLQILLNAKNGEKLEVDNSCGSLTEAAIKRYQAKKGLEVDGVCGKNTWNSLINS